MFWYKSTKCMIWIRSDEMSLDVTWWQILLSTITIVIVGMCISIGCRWPLYAKAIFFIWPWSTFEACLCWMRWWWRWANSPNVKIYCDFFLVRSLANTNCKGCFHCQFCRSDKKCQVKLNNSENNETVQWASPLYGLHIYMRDVMPLQATYSQLPAQNGKATSSDQVWHVQFLWS